MITANYFTAQNHGALLIVTLEGGDRITIEIPKDKAARAWLKNGLLEGGQGIKGYRAYIAGAALIDGTDIYQYTANEAREILGLED